MILMTRVLAIALLFGITGCSKCSPGEDSAANTSGTSAKDKYIAKLDELCRAADDDSGSAAEKLAKPTNPEEALQWSVDILNISLDSQDAVAKEIQGMEPPSEDSALLQQIFQEDSKRREAARAAGKALLSEMKKSELDDLTARINGMKQAVSDLAQKYGFKFCFLVE